METLEILDISSRKTMGSRSNNRLRKLGYIPGCICAKGKDSISISIKRDSLQKAINKLGRSSVFKLKLDGKQNYNVMIKDMQAAPLSGECLDIVFQHVSLSEETKADVALKIEGRDFLEINKLRLTQQMDTIQVKGLPNDIPNSIEIDVSKMAAGDNLFIKDIKLPKDITTEMDLEQLVLSVSQQRMAAQQEETEEADTEETAD